MQSKLLHDDKGKRTFAVVLKKKAGTQLAKNTVPTLAANGSATTILCTGFAPGRISASPPSP